MSDDLLPAERKVRGRRSPACGSYGAGRDGVPRVRSGGGRELSKATGVVTPLALLPRFNQAEVEVTSHLNRAEQEALSGLLRSMYRAVDRNGD